MTSNGEREREILRRVEPVGLYEFTKYSGERRQALETDIQELCCIFSAADPVSRAEIARGVSDSCAFAFLWFARIMAEKAVRESSADAVWCGLMSLLIENFHRDYRDTLHRLILVYHSAVKLELDAQGLFAKASDLAVSHLAAQLVHDFPLRPADSRSLGAFTWKETGCGTSFGYRRLDDPELLF
jgi:hypothetical protein